MQTNKTYIIAEAGVNHNGNLELAEELIVQAAKVGADAVKFQTFKAETLVHPSAVQAEYQKKECGDIGQYKLLKNLELSQKDFILLKEIARRNNIEFLSTPFDLNSLDFLLTLDLSYIKVSSGDITFGPLLLKAAQHNKKILISTGMTTMEEIKNALYVLAYGYKYPKSTPSSFQEIVEYASKINLVSVLYEKVTVLHCTSEYPAPFEEINLNVLDSFKSELGLKIGYSDHSIGITVPQLAVAKGASVIEKHFTLNHNLPGPDQKASLNIEQFAQMVRMIRFTESVLGKVKKEPTLSELKNRSIVRKGVYFADKIINGHLILDRDLICLRPQTGLSPMSFWDIVGTKAKSDFKALDEVNG